MDINMKTVAVCVVALLLGIAIMAVADSGKVTQKVVDQKIADALAAQKSELSTQYAAALTSAVEKVRADDQLVVDAANAQIADLQKQIDELKNPPVEDTTPEVIVVKYVLDEINIDELFSDTIGSRELKTLVNTEIEFNDEDYDVKESVALSDMKVVVNTPDNGVKDYLSFESGAIEYKYAFDSTFDNDDVTEDETLSFTLFGENVEISEWTDDSITFTKGAEYDVKEGESVTVDGKVIQATVVGWNYAYITVGTDSAKVTTGSTKEVGGIEIEVKDTIETQSWRAGVATIVVGDDVSTTVEDGDEYAKDSIWEWKITPSTIGVVLSEDFTSTDADDDFVALAAGKSVALPNDYVTFTYDGFGAFDSSVYTFDTYTKDSVDYVRVKGDFVNGVDSYDKIYVKADGIYDEDFVLIGTSVELGDTDATLSSGPAIAIGDIRLGLLLKAVTVDGVSISGVDEDYINDYGIVISNPEDSVDDQEFKLTVPEEALEATVTLTS
jgi:hypothetical protein